MTGTYLYGGSVHANGIRQHYLRFGGAGPRLMVVPGITSPAITWAFAAERLGETYDVYVLDVRGRGLSAASPDIDYGLDALARDTAAFAEAFGLDKYGMIGHSMGGRIVPAAVVRAGATPSRIMLVDPPMTGPGRRGYSNTDAWFTDQIAAGARGGMTIEEMRPYFPRWSDAALQLRTEWIHTCDPRAVLQTRKDLLTDDFHAELPRIAIPILVLAAGQADVILPEEEAELRTLNPRLQTLRMHEAGHMIPWDDLEGFLAACRDFFR